jgi:ABC-2 type transport system ATP-binding protein
MQQRVGIARTLLHDPEVLILDEPANGLDPKARIEMREILLRLADQGKTLIVTSHILPELARICSTVAIVTGGKLRAFGKLDDVMKSICPRRSYEIQVSDTTDFAAAERSIADLLLEDEPIEASQAEHLFRFPTSRTEAELSEVLKRLIIGGVAIAQFREVASDLEDAFLTIAQSKVSA